MVPIIVLEMIESLVVYKFMGALEIFGEIFVMIFMQYGFDYSGRYVTISSDGNTVSVGDHTNAINVSFFGNVCMHVKTGNLWVKVYQDVEG